MSNVNAIRDDNHVPVALGAKSTNAAETTPFTINPVTGRLLTDNAGGGSGDVVGPASSTDKAVARFDGITGKLIQDSVVIISNLGAVTGVTTMTAQGIALEETGAGTDTITFQAPASIAASYTLTFPVDDGNSGEVLSTNGSGVLSWVTAGGVPTTITVANEATDTSCFIGFFTAATGDLGPKTNTNITFNSNTGVATFGQTIVGSISGNAATATNVAVGGITGLGTGVATALAINVGSAGAFVTFNGALGTPSSGTATNLTGLPIAGITGLGTGVATALAINVGSAGAFVTFNGALGTPSSGTVTNLTGTASININGTVGATTPAAGTFTTVTTSGAVELGNASDTSLTRNAAGVLAIEGEVMNGYTATATAAGTTTLTIASNRTQVFTGSTTQTVKLPTTSVILGQTYIITNTSTGLVTVQSSGANTIVTLGLNQSAIFTALAATPTTAGNWSYNKINAAGNANGKRLLTVTQSATPSMDTDNGDIMQMTGLAQAITSMTTNLTGTPNEGDFIEIQITDNGTARGITWGASFANGGLVNLPTTTVISVMLRVLLQRTGSVWSCVAVA